MGRIRRKTERALHAPWGDAVDAWTPTAPETSFWGYALRFGVSHLVAMGELERARRRLSDLLFTGAYLDWCYATLADDFTPLLKTWRALGTEGAAEAYRQAVRTVGDVRPEHLVLLRQVVDFLGDASWREAALDAAEATVALHREVLGPDHAETATSETLWALALKASGRNEEGIPLGIRALAAHRETLGADAPALYVTMNSLASMLNAAKRYDEAEPLFREAITHRTRLLGAGHPKTLISVASFAFMLTKMGQHEAAEPFHRRAYDGRKRLLGDRHPKTLTSAVNLGRCLTELGQYGEGEAVLLEAVTVRREVLGVDHSRTLNAERRLAECHKARNGEA